MDSLEDRLEEALDDGLRMTFPASDPVAVSTVGRTLTLDTRADDRNARAAAGEEPH